MAPEPLDTATTSPRAGWLAGLFGLQALAAAFFLSDVLADLLGYPDFGNATSHHLVEAAITAALILGLVFTGRELRRILGRQRRLEAQLSAASGAFHELLEESFESWGLTASERDVALMAIKGLSIAEIAALRQTREGTVKSQCNAIYTKAGVSGRPQLLSLFIDELMGEGLV